MKTTTLTEIADQLYFESHGEVPRKKISFLTNLCFNLIADKLLDGNKVMITNFGRFKRTKHNSVSFIPAPKIKKQIRNQKDKIFDYMMTDENNITEEELIDYGFEQNINSENWFELNNLIAVNLDKNIIRLISNNNHVDCNLDSKTTIDDLDDIIKHWRKINEKK